MVGVEANRKRPADWATEAQQSTKQTAPGIITRGPLPMPVLQAGSEVKRDLSYYWRWRLRRHLRRGLGLRLCPCCGIDLGL